MAKARGLRIAVNLLLVPLLALLLWIGLGYPLPPEQNYRRMERAMLQEPMEILEHNEEWGLVISADEKQMAIFCDDWRGGTVLPNAFLLTPLEGGVGVVADCNFYDGLSVWAYEAAGAAVRAEMRLTLLHEEFGPVEICRESARENDVFYFLVERFDPWSENWKDQTLVELAERELGKSVRTDHEYRLEITFYDEAGNVTAVRESGYER